MLYQLSYGPRIYSDLKLANPHQRREPLTVFCNIVFSDGANPNGTMRLPLLMPLRLDVHPLRGDRDHDAFAPWVLSSSERAVFKSQFS